MVPVDGSHVLQEVLVDREAMVPAPLDGPFQAHGVLQDDGGDHEVEAARAVAL